MQSIKLCSPATVLGNAVTHSGHSRFAPVVGSTLCGKPARRLCGNTTYRKIIRERKKHQAEEEEEEENKLTSASDIDFNASSSSAPPSSSSSLASAGACAFATAVAGAVGVIVGSFPFARSF